MKTRFDGSAHSYLRIAGLGLLAGLAVVFFLAIPDHPLWGFHRWSAATFGFWMCSTSRIVLTSKTRTCGAVGAGLYIFLMFLVTTVGQSALLFRSGGTPFASLPELAAHSVPGWLWYSLPPAMLCAALGAVLWSGRKRTRWGNILRILPACFLLAETALLLKNVAAHGTDLFSALTDLGCLIWYLAASGFFRRIAPIFRRFQKNFERNT